MSPHVDLRALAQNPSLRRGNLAVRATDNHEATPSPEEVKMDCDLNNHEPQTMEQPAQEPVGQRTDREQENGTENSVTNGCVLNTGSEPGGEGDLNETDSNLHVEVALSQEEPPVPVPSQLVAVAVSVVDLSAQVREANTAVVDEYMRLLRIGKEFPAIELRKHVDRDGGVRYYLVDGLHRLEANRRLGRTEILGDVTPGDLRDAKWAAACSNSTHGLNRSDDDKNRQVSMVLDDEEWRKLSNQQIARHCVVSPTFVSKVRQKYEADHGITPEEGATRRAKDGRLFKVSARQPEASATKTQQREEQVSADAGSVDAAVPTADLLPAQDEKLAAGQTVDSGLPELTVGASSQVSDPIEAVLTTAVAPGMSEPPQHLSAPSSLHDDTQSAVTTDVAAESHGTPVIDALLRVDGDGKIRVSYVAHGARSHIELEVDNENQNLPAELVTLRSFIRNTNKLRDYKVSHATLQAILNYLMPSE